MILIIVGLISFALLAVLRRDLALYLIVPLLPAYQIRFQVFGIPATFLEGMILILAVVELTHLTVLSLRGVQRRSNPLTSRLLHFVRNDKWTLIFILLFLLAALISVFTAPNLAKAAGIFKAYFLEAIIFYFLTLLIIDTPEKIKRLFKTLAILVLYLSLFGVYQFITLYGLPYNWWAVGVESRRIISVLNHPNGLALLLGPVLAMLIMLRSSPLLSTLRGRGIKGEGVLYWSAIILGIAALYLSFSRAAWLALIITIALFGLFSWRFRLSPPARGGDEEGVGGERSNSGVKVGAVTLAIIFLIMIIPFSRAKILDLVRGQDLSQQNRYVLWSAAADILKKSPLTGTGLMGFHEAYKNYPLGPDRVVQNYPHNFFLNFWVETGLLGLISITALLILFYRKVYLLLKAPSPSPSPQGRGMKTNPSPLSPFERSPVGGRGEDKGESGGSKSLALAAAAGMSMIILHGLVDVSYFKNDLSVLFWLIFALPNLFFLNPQKT